MLVRPPGAVPGAFRVIHCGFWSPGQHLSAVDHGRLVRMAEAGAGRSVNELVIELAGMLAPDRVHARAGCKLA